MGSLIAYGVEMQAIQVRYLGPTDTKGSRMKAFCLGGSHTINIDNARSIGYNAKRAAFELASQLNWPGNYVGGTLPCGDVVFVNEPMKRITGEDEFFFVPKQLCEVG